MLSLILMLSLLKERICLWFYCAMCHTSICLKTRFFSDILSMLSIVLQQLWNIYVFQLKSFNHSFINSKCMSHFLKYLHKVNRFVVRIAFQNEHTHTQKVYTTVHKVRNYFIPNGNDTNFLLSSVLRSTSFQYCI